MRRTAPKKRKRRTTNNRKQLNTRLVIAALVIIIVAIFVFILPKVGKDSGKIIMNNSTLEKIVKASDLSTFEAVYNGIAKVTDPENAEKVNYYVSYEAKIKAGIDFKNVKIRVDNRTKVISVTLPEIKITDITVDIGSLDYIFVNNKSNTSTVSEEAYRECIADATNESSNENAIYELAEQNAKNIIEALIDPFVSSLDSEYQLQIA